MNPIERILAEQARKSKDLTAMTVRVPAPVKAYVEHFSEQLSLSRQDALLTLIETGIETAQRTLDKAPDQVEIDCDDEPQTTNFFVLNTNRKHSDEDQELMLNEGLALASYDPWKYEIEKIKKGDWVFLYENSVGVIAYGEASGTVLIRDHKYPNDKEVYCQKLENFQTLSEPITAKELRNTLGYEQPLLRTLSRLKNAKQQAEALLSLAQDRA